MTASPKVISWNAFKTWVGERAKTGMPLFCRGQSDEAWGLQTTFHREAGKRGLTIPQYLDGSLADAVVELAPHINEQMDLADSNQLGSLLCLLQHHGFPTPLLDWTHSPYIAAYFAMSGVDLDSPSPDNVRIFFFDAEGWSAAYPKPGVLRSDEHFVSVIRPYPKYNPRSVPQRGVFTITNAPDMLAHIQANEAARAQTFLLEFRISVKEAAHALRDLDLMGLNHGTLFPGIDGSCQVLKQRHFGPLTVGQTSSERRKSLLGSFKKPRQRKKTRPPTLPDPPRSGPPGSD